MSRSVIQVCSSRFFLPKRHSDLAIREDRRRLETLGFQVSMYEALRIVRRLVYPLKVVAWLLKFLACCSLLPISIIAQTVCNPMATGDVGVRFLLRHILHHDIDVASMSDDGRIHEPDSEFECVADFGFWLSGGHFQ